MKETSRHIQIDQLTPKVKHVDYMKWMLLILCLAFVTVSAIQLISVRKQIWFSINNPKAVSICIEGYQGEHSEADRRFEAKQRGTLVSPLVDEAKKE